MGHRRAHSLGVHPQERIGRDLAGERNRQGGAAGLAHDAGFLDAMAQGRVMGIHGAGERGIGQRVFVTATDQRGVGQRREALERCEHLRRRAFEQAAAAQAEEGVPAEQVRSSVRAAAMERARLQREAAQPKNTEGLTIAQRKEIAEIEARRSVLEEKAAPDAEVK